MQSIGSPRSINYSHTDPFALDDQAMEPPTQPQLNYPQLRPFPRQASPVYVRSRNNSGRFRPTSNRVSKVCGWCKTNKTTQWRIGCTTGSEASNLSGNICLYLRYISAMKTLCNACGINYRRAQKMVPFLVVDLDVLAQKQHIPLSIQKELKRQLRQSQTVTQFRRMRPGQRGRPRDTSLRMMLSDGSVFASQQQATSSERNSYFSNDENLPTSPAPLSTSSLAPGAPLERVALPPFREFIRDLVNQ